MPANNKEKVRSKKPKKPSEKVDLKSAGSREGICPEENLFLNEFTIDQLRDMAFWTWTDGRFFFVNEEACRSLGYTKQELLSMSIPDIDVDFSSERLAEFIENNKDSGHVLFESKFITKDGRVFPVEISSNYFVIGDKGYMVSLCRDITGRKRAEEALRESEKKYRSLAEHVNDWVWEIDANGIYTYASPRVRELLGYEPGEIVGTSPFDYMAPEESQRVRALFNPIFDAKGEFSLLENTLIKKDGGMVMVETSGMPIFDARGTFKGYRGSDRDITGRKLAEEAIIRSEQMLQQVIDNIPQGIFWKDRNSTYLGCNKVIARATGLGTPRNIIGKTDYDLPWPREQADHFREYDRKIMESDTPEYHIVEQQREASGMTVWVETNKAPLHDVKGNVTGILGTYEDITERKRAEDALRESEEKYRSLIESISDMVWEIDDNFCITYVSRQTRDLMGYDVEEVIGRPPFDFILPDDQEMFRALIEEAFLARAPIELMRYRARRKDGRVIYLETNGVPIFDRDGSFKGYRGIHRDVTERKRAEEAIKLANAYNRSLIEASLDPLVTISPDGRVTDVNKATEKVTGLSREHLIGTDFSDYFTEPEKAKEGYLTAFKEGSVTDYPLEIRHRDGHVTPVIYNASVYRDESGNVIGVFAAARDITEQKKIEEARLRLAAIVDSSDDAIIGKTLDGIITSWNAGAMKLYGYSEDEVIGKPVSILASADYPDEIPSILEKIRHGEHIDHYETVRKRKDGGIINVSLSVSPIKDSKGRLVGASTITRDITEKKRSEEAIRLASAYNRSLIEASLDPLVTISPDGRITDVNKATEAVTGYTREYLIGTDFSDYFTGPQKAKEGYLKVFKEGSVTDYPLEIRHRDGHVTPVIYNASVYRDESGNVIGVFAAARDITERRRAENALRDAKDQVELYVDLMGHDINNMNQVSMGFLELAHNIIEMEGKLGEENIVLLDKAMDSLKNSSQLIDNVRKLQREKMGLYEPEVLDVCSVIEDAIKQFHGIPGRDVRITCEPFEGCPVRANSLLKDVFINLVGNAIKHSRGSLSINIGASRVVDNGKAYCRVDVEDDGPGIPDQLKSTLFDRLSLSTTRARGKGFGLCLIKMLVDDYRGRFWAEDRVPGDHSKGARFVVMLPAVVD